MASASDRRRLTRALALALLGALGVPGAASCTSALGLDGYANAQSALCDKITECYASGAPPCQAMLADRLVGTDVSSWLTSFSGDTCLGSCASARRCLDLPPVCMQTLAACQETEDCCNFSVGQADCIGGRCCKTRGIPCSSHDECCATIRKHYPESPL
jgi:hypothetical protein